MNKKVLPPIAKKMPHTLTTHGHQRVDNYYWMRDDNRANAEVLAHLEQENNYVKEYMSPHKDLQDGLFEEMKGRIVKDDSSVPVKDGSYWYYSKVTGDNEYASHFRSSNEQGDDSQCVLDINQLAEGQQYFDVGEMVVSPNEQLLAYSEDLDGRRIYTFKFIDLQTGQYLSDELENTEGGLVWANDNKTIFYVKKDAQTLLGFQVFRHVLGTSQTDDVLVYEEHDRQFYMGLGKTRDDSQIIIGLGATQTSDFLVLDANQPLQKFKKVSERLLNHEYSFDKLGQYYYIVSNHNAHNFKVCRATDQTLHDISQWQTLIPHRANVLIEGVELFNSHFVVTERELGQVRFVVHDYQGDHYTLTFDDPCYSAHLGSNPDPSSNSVRIGYTSMITPNSVFDCDLQTGKKVIKKQRQILGDFNADDYTSERIFIKARDGVEVPVSLVYKRDLFKKDGSNPLFQYGYGAYGITIDPRFSSNNLSLLDRGFVYAIAHIRGSEMLGRDWYEQGKKQFKTNTFNDFIDVTKGLVEQGYADKNKVFASGGSAGGLLMGAIVNQAPELYLGIGCHVPFLDVLTTMLDESIPLTTNEYDEWGNPNNKADYEYILAYSPYDNITSHDYPNILVTTGLHDSQVQYWEPMKWVAKLREYKQGQSTLLFKTDMDSGHGGASGRFKRLEDDALEMAFFISLLNVTLI